MALTFTPLSWLLWSGKHQEPKISNGSSSNSSPDSGLWELDTLKFPLDRRRNMSSSSRKVKRKWQSREERKIDREYDIVIVPSDGGCVSGSESDDSDWSVGWLEPHGPGFHCDDDSDDSFAVLVPCYGCGCANVEENAEDKFLQAVGNLNDIYATELALKMCDLYLLLEHWCKFAVEGEVKKRMTEKTEFLKTKEAKGMVVCYAFYHFLCKYL
ncbi:uncharacterized protein [Nicotiana tomentosiformis]|nr:uncharacterized protein LOC104120048 isoform X3 [Nicotiana tomentosiformis]XP_009630011.1 uncharacterized protein LOC104120048 isoform X3 [Nicotiana tomentosiformis]